MMLTRIIKHLFFISLLLPLIALPLLYLALQTSVGAAWLSKALSHYSDYQINIKQVNYSFSTPLQFELGQLQIEHNEQKLAEIGRVTVTINPKFINTPNSLDNILLENGRLNLDAKTLANFTLNSNWLQLKNIDLAFNSAPGRTELNQVNAGISPWKTNQIISPNSTFQLSAQRFSVNQLTGQHLLIKGRVRQGNLIIDTFGTNLPNGEITAQAQRNKQGNWTINNLYINRFRWQTSESLQQAFQSLSRSLLKLPVLDIQRLDIINANLEGNRWALSEANLSLQNIQWQNGQWSAKNGLVNFSAGDAIFHKLQFSDPIVKLSLNNLDIIIQQASARWQGGLIKTDGFWRYNKLELNDAIIAAVEYTLPENWRELLDYQFPEWLQTVNINNLKLNRSVIVDINPDFPFQITLLEIDGKELCVVSDRHAGLWRGELSAYANNATFNKVDLRHPAITLTANDEQIQVTKMNAFVDKGLIDGQLTINQSDRHHFNLNLTGQNIPLSLLSHWGWQQAPINGEGNLKFSLSREGIAYAVKARLEATDRQRQKTLQTLPERDALLDLEFSQPMPLPELSDLTELTELPLIEPSELRDIPELPELIVQPNPDELAQLPELPLITELSELINESENDLLIEEY